MVAKAKWNLASFSSLSLSPPVIFQKVAIPFVGSAVVGRNMEWSYEEALSVARSQVVKGCLSISEVAEKNDEAAGAKSKSKAVEAADLDTLALTPRMRKAGVETRISNLESEILILREQVVNTNTRTNSIYLQKSMSYEIMRVRESGQWDNGESHSSSRATHHTHRPVALCISVCQQTTYCSSIHSTATPATPTPTAITPLTQAGEAINHDQIYKGREDHTNHTYIYS